MRDVGIAVEPGSGVALAEEYWRQATSPASIAEKPMRAVA